MNHSENSASLALLPHFNPRDPPPKGGAQCRELRNKSVNE